MPDTYAVTGNDNRRGKHVIGSDWPNPNPHFRTRVRDLTFWTAHQTV